MRRLIAKGCSSRGSRGILRCGREPAGIEHDLHIYDAVDHGFWLRVDGDPEVRTAPALDAWERLKAYLDRTLRP